MSEHKNRLILAVAAAAIAVIVLGTVSYTFFPAQQSTNHSTTGSFGLYGVVGAAPVLPSIVISSDGTVNSTDLSRAGNVYTQTCNIQGQNIIVDKDGVVLNGSGFELLNSQVTLSQVSGVTVEDMQFANASSITLNNASHCVITQDYVPEAPDMILEWLYLNYSNSNVISHNNLTMANIQLMFSSNNLLTGNSLSNGTAALDSFGIELEWGTNNTATNNYFKEVLTPVEDEYSGNTISDNNMVDCDQGVRVLGSNSTVFANNMTYADLGYHTEASDWMTGIVIDGSYNSVYKNNVTGYALAGISIDGISEGDAFFENIIACNNYGVLIGPSGAFPVDNNTFYHNDFINNYQSVMISSPDSAETNQGSAYFINSWDNGSQGNYWSDHQQQGSYAIDGHNSDLYPLQAPYMGENISSYPTPFAGQTKFPYGIYDVSPIENDEFFADHQYSVSVDFYTLPPYVTLQLSPNITILNMTVTGLRTCTFYLPMNLPPSTTYNATVTFGENSNNTQSYTWYCFKTPP